MFCFSVGRSGSTLLLRILNAHDDISLCGEHAGFLKPLLHSIDELGTDPAAKNMQKGYTESDVDEQLFSPWRQNHPPEHFVQATAKYMQECFEEPGKVWGFKETRYKAPEVKILQKIVPDAHYVLLARNPVDHTVSSLFAFGRAVPDDDAGVLELADKRLANWIRTYEDHLPLFENSITVLYEDLVSSSTARDNLFARLGHRPPRPDQLDAVLNEKVGSSYTGRLKARRRKKSTTALIETRSELYPQAMALYAQLQQQQ